MKIVFHDRFHRVHTRDPAAASGRLIPAEKTLGEIRSALILDIDIHFGDGTYNIFKDRPSVQYLHPDGDFNGEWLMDCEKELKRATPADIIAVSAGFDSHADDWGGILLTEDYGTVGKMVKEWAEERCYGRKPFVVLEGGYNYHSVAEAALALCQGLE
jgi:acetoin utilization deacetylase AcuC-like enzyme